jgi:hypothetical protein
MKKEENDFITGNVDSKYKIPRKNLHCYWVHAEKRIIDPRDPTHPIIRSRAVCFQPFSYRAYFMGTAESNIGFMKAMGFENCSLIWDPTTEEAKKLNAAVLAEEAANRDPGADAELKYRQGRKTATVNDIWNSK